MREKNILTGVAIILILVAAVVGTRLVHRGQKAITAEPRRTLGPANAAVTIVEFSDFACRPMLSIKNTAKTKPPSVHWLHYYSLKYKIK